MNLLQSQINPHFLYSTLRTAQYMASKGDIRAADVVKRLIFLFQSGIYRSVSDEYTLANEMKRV